MYNNYGWGNIRKYGYLEFKSFSISAHKPGETLQQFVDICLGQTNESYYIEERSLPSGPVILYHGSINGNYDKILNNSPNTGKRYEVARTSSFWFKEKEYAEMFATAELLQELSDKKIFILIDNDMKTLVNDQYKSLALNIIKNNNCYVYSKTIDGKNVTGGQGRNFPEYTIDFTVKPDNVESVSYKNKLNSIKFVSKDYIDKIIEKYKKDKMTYNNGLFGQIKDSLIYSGTKDIWDVKRTMKKYNESYIEESEKLSDYDFIDIKSHKPLSLKYLQDNSETKKYAKDTIDNYNGELVIYNDSMIGRILVGDKKDKGFITDFSIDEDHRGNKLGSKLLDDAINKYHGVDLVVDKSNTVAIDMYKRRGFVIIKTNKDMGDQYYMKLKSKLDKDDKILNEGFFKSEPDILYNKEAFDNGDINICFITGQSGSGKSTLAHSQESKKVEVYEMDDLMCIKDHFTMDNLKEYGELIYTFFKKYPNLYKTFNELVKEKIPGSEYEDKLYPGFVDYAIKWAKVHKNKKYIIEGVWLYCHDDNNKPYFEPSYFKDYAFYIKGTSAIKSIWRSTLRDSKDTSNILQRLWILAKPFSIKDLKWYKLNEKDINRFRDYFKNKPETVLSEACTGIFDKIEDNPEIVETYGFKSSDNIYNVNVKIKGFNKWLRGRSELLVIKDNKIYLKKDSKKGYSIPGGGWEENEDHNLAAIRETNEEAKIKVKNVNYVCSYAAYFPPKDWVKERISEENWWYGEYIELYIGEYDGEFKGKIEDIDKSDYMASGKFYDIKSVYKDLIPQHQKAIDDIMHENAILESVSGFKKVKLDKKLIESDKEFKHLRTDNCKGYAFYDKDNLVGYVNTERKSNEIWIQALVIKPEYQSQGYGRDILDIAVKDLKARYLSVNKKNDIAISLYKKYGFKIYKETESMYFMSLDEEISESLGYYTYNTGVEVYNSSKEMQVLNRVLAGKVNSTNYKWYYINIDSYVPETAKKIQGSIVTLYGFKEQPKTNNLLREAPDTLYEIKYNNYYVRQSDLNKRLVPFMYGNGAPKKGYIILSEGGEYIMDNNISEAMNALMTGFIPGSVDNPNNVYIVNYMQNNVFSGEDPNEDCIGVSSDPLFTNMIIRGKDGILKKVDESFLDDKSYKVYIAEKSIKDISETISPYIDKEVEFGFLYEAVTGKKLYTKDQIGLEGVLIPTVDYYTYMDQFKEVCDNFFFAKDKQEIPVSETFIPSKVRYFNNSGLMYESDTNNDVDSYIQAKPEKILEFLDININ
jgi:ribosomal protein S18 acetylase RimI-like enzyme